MELVRVRDTKETYEARYKGRKASNTRSRLGAALAVVSKTRDDNKWYLYPLALEEVEEMGKKTYPGYRYYEVVEK